MVVAAAVVVVVVAAAAMVAMVAMAAMAAAEMVERYCMRRQPPLGSRRFSVLLDKCLKLLQKQNATRTKQCAFRMHHQKKNTKGISNA